MPKTKPRTALKKPREWHIYLHRKKGELLGPGTAPEQEIAIKEFGIVDPQKQERLSTEAQVEWPPNDDVMAETLIAVAHDEAGDYGIATVKFPGENS